MKRGISVVIPAYNEADRLGETLRALTTLNDITEVIVVDDGSEDETATVAHMSADRVIVVEENKGKGHAMEIGWRESSGSIIVFLDADLGKTAPLVTKLMEPVLLDKCDMTIAKFPPAETRGGFGLVKKLADEGVMRLTGYRISAPLSGQRAVKRRLLEAVSPLAYDFGIEISLTVKALRHGFHICEVPLAFQHRESGRNWQGFMHRGKQFVDISRTLYRLWRTTS